MQSLTLLHKLALHLLSSKKIYTMITNRSNHKTTERSSYICVFTVFPNFKKNILYNIFSNLLLNAKPHGKHTQSRIKLNKQLPECLLVVLKSNFSKQAIKHLISFIHSFSLYPKSRFFTTVRLRKNISAKKRKNQNATNI